MKKLGFVIGMILMLLIVPIDANDVQIQEESIPAATNILLKIDFGNGTILNYSGLSATNVYNLTASMFELEVIWSGGRVFITSIDGVSQDESNGWQYWVNGNYAAVAANEFSLSDGDFVLWNRTISKYQSSAEPDQSLLFGGVLLASSGIIFLALLYYRSRR